ncbi:MAG: hypothetical protein MR924_05160 [Prevotella sp.]|nr:hypothetical protein [Prevotella sp.]
MKTTDQTIQQIERAIRKVADKFPATQEASIFTDIHIRVNQETGELVAFDDDDREITRVIIEKWINNQDDGFYDAVAKQLRKCIEREKKLVENMAVIRPYSFILEDEDKENIAELYVVDDDTVIIDPDLMEGLDKDLDDFLEKLLKEE